MNKQNTFTGSYPEIEDPQFYRKINKKKEFADSEISKLDREVYFLQPQQRFLYNYINDSTGYNKILVYHSVGVGKTMSAISIAYRNKGKYNIMVVAKNRNIEDNFKKQVDIFSREINDDDKSWASGIGYATYRSLVSSGENSDWTKKSLSNTILIFDEIHNALGNEVYGAIMKILREGVNLKLVLLSATPVFDNATEIFELANIIGGKKDLEIETGEFNLVKAGYIKKSDILNDKSSRTSGTDLSEFKMKGIYELTNKGREIITKRFRGKVSYLTADSRTFPSRRYIGERVSEKSGSFGIKVVKCIMSEFQEKIYIETTSKKDDLFKKSSDALTMVYPNGEIGTTGFSKNKKTFDKILKKENLKKYSCKISEILSNIKKSIGPVFIYSNFVNKGGIDLVKNVLLENGYENYGGRGNNSKIVVFGENFTPESRQKILRVFNNKENSSGEKIKVILGGPSVSEGITFKNLEQIHILEPYWNMSRLEQVIGRGVRMGSHSFLPSTRRFVNIFMYCAVSKNPRVTTIDSIKYSLAEAKDKVIKEIEGVLRDSAVDCTLNRKRNLENLKGFTDNSRECMYKKCEYTCLSGDSLIEKNKIDYSTYIFDKSDPFRYAFLKKKLLNYISGNEIFKFGDINGYFSKNYRSKSSPEDIVFILNEIMTGNVVYKNSNNIESVLKKRGEFFFSNPLGNPLSEPLFNKLFVKKYNRTVDKRLSEENNSKISKKTKTKRKARSIKNENFIQASGSREKNIPKKTTGSESLIKNKVSREYLKKEGVFGYFSEDGNVLKILDNRSPSEEIKDNDNRSIFRGKTCSSFKISDIKDMIEYLDKKEFEGVISRNTERKIQKQDLCDILGKILVKKSKII